MTPRRLAQAFHNLSTTGSRCDEEEAVGGGVAQICNLYRRFAIGGVFSKFLRVPHCARPAECNSAIQQITNLRYGCEISASALVLLTCLMPSVTVGASINMPTVKDPRLEISLFAAEPDIMTPIGLAIDQRGRIFVLESHTHFPPADYPGPKRDRVKIFQPANGVGKMASIFADDLYHGMNLAFSSDGQLYVTHRNGVIVLHDKEGDGVSESRTTILELKTTGDYPHNGIGGIAFSHDGWLYVGMGENLGVDYTLKGSDGSSHSGGGEGGNVFRCRPDGSRLQLVATGFWNPFALAFYQNDFLLAVDNDPDSRPPCRLLDIVMHGDYGYKFRYGRSGLHPFTAWNGELPGALPMIAGTGEAPSGILACDQARLPGNYRDAVLATSWGDHRLEVFRPKPFGASLRADRETLIESDEWFRPVALAAAPDGDIYFTDWVDRSYSVHQKGRLWRLSARKKAATKPVATFNARVAHNPDRRRMNYLLRAEANYSELVRCLADRDAFIRSAAVGALAQPHYHERLRRELDSKNPQIRLGALLALRQGKYEKATPLLDTFLADPDEQIRLLAVSWAGEAGLSSLTNRLNAALSAGPVSPLLLRAYTAASSILTGGKLSTHQPVIGDLGSTPQPPSGVSPAGNQKTHVICLVTKPEEEQFLELLRRRTHENEMELCLEAVRNLAGTTNSKAVAVLKALAHNKKKPAQLRSEAIVALASLSIEDMASLITLLDDRSPEVRIETARALRLVAAHSSVRGALEKKLGSIRDNPRDAGLAEQLLFALRGPKGAPRPASDEEWRRVLAQPGDAQSGRRAFFNPAIGCAKCHRIEDHGGPAGPDLSVITRGADRERLMQSILHPSRDMAPQYVARAVETRDNQTFSGISPGQGPDGSLTLVTADGQGVWIPARQIVSDVPSTVSLMPEGLESGLTLQDFRDLLAFLLSRK